MFRAWIHGLEMGGINEAKRKKRKQEQSMYAED